MGLKEQIVFPEINYDKIDKVRGMDIIVTTTARPTTKRASCSGCSVSRSRMQKQQAAEGSARRQELKSWRN